MVVKLNSIMNARIKATTLVEVVIALLIIMVVFGASTTLFVKIMNANPAKSDYWQQELQLLATEIKTEASCSNAEYPQEDGTTIYQYCEPYQPDSPLLLLKLEAVHNNQIMASYEEIYFQKAE